MTMSYHGSCEYRHVRDWHADTLFVSCSYKPVTAVHKTKKRKLRQKAVSGGVIFQFTGRNLRLQPLGFQTNTR